MPALADRLAEVGASVVPLPPPPSQDPPTSLRKSGAGGGFAPVVSTYTTVPYADVDPTIPSAIAYVVMFGMMFADAGQGLLLALAGLLLRWNRLPRLASRMLAGTPGAARASKPAVFLVDAETPDVSSTEVRRRIRRGASIAGLVPAAVERHITQHRLYLDKAAQGPISTAADHLHGKD